MARSGRSVLAVASALTVAVSPLFPAGSALADVPGHEVVVSAVPPARTPDIQDESVETIFDAGAKVIAGGDFTRVQNHGSDVDITRRFILAFSKDTGHVDTAFAPAVNGEVRAIVAGPVPGTVFIAGRFTSVNGTTRRKVALVDLASGALVTTFRPPAFNGLINDMVLVGGRLLVAGTFTKAGRANPRGGLASLDATTGAVDSYLTVNLTGHHNYNGISGAKAAVGVENLAVSPDGTSAVVIGNFKQADGVVHDQVVKLDLGATSATVADWNTDRYAPRCRYTSFDSYVRDVAYAPDGSYFVVVTTGAKYANTLCDTVARWNDGAIGSSVEPVWVDHSGGDTFLSVGISEKAVYVGGHMRWMNNSFGSDRARSGAVGRPGIAALDPVNGLPLRWNPGRHPRGVGAGEIHVTAEGVWVGSDTAWIGNFSYRRERIAFFPTSGGYAPHPTAVAHLPGTVYLASTGGDTLSARGYDGTGGVGATRVFDSGSASWSSVRGGFWVGGSLFYGQGGALYRRGFDGATLGAASLVDPYHDPAWDTVETGSGTTTYAGVTTGYYSELSGVTGAFYSAGRLYYTLSGSSGLFWRWFTPDSGIVGADRFQVSGTSAFRNAGGMFLDGGRLYLVDRNSGTLSRMNWANGAPSGAATVVSGPAVDGADWRNRSIFLAP